MMDFEAARVKMVENQIRTTDVTSHSVLTAFYEVARETFVPEAARRLAYIDNDIEICPATSQGPARFLMEASPMAKLLQLAAVTKKDRVLEIGCGTGYATAIFSRIAQSVVAIESHPDLLSAARINLADRSNVHVVQGDLEAGWPDRAPYDLIFIDGAVEEVPGSLFAQLAEGGRLVAVQGYGNSARAKVYVFERGSISESVFFNISVKPLPGFLKAREFIF